MARLISDISGLLRRTIGEAITLAIKTDDTAWNIYADSNQLENALLNLAVNSRDAMPNGGTLTITTELPELSQPDVAALTEPVATGEYVVIAVADTGIGMDPATMEHIFEPFFTTKDVGKGTGLGLSQVYGFVRQSSGHVRVDSAPGTGTTFKIYLPRHIGGDKEIITEPKQKQSRGRGEERILVVEDDDALRAYATEALRDLDYQVLDARDGSAALEVLEQTPAIDLLLTDIVMPGGMNGRQLADTARSRRPTRKVLFMTGYSGNVIGEHGHLDPDVRVIGKPFSIDALVSRMRDIFDGDAND